MRNAFAASIVVLALAIVGLLPLVGAGPIVFGHTWGTDADESASAVLVDSNGNVFLSGNQVNTTDFVQRAFVVKFDPHGNLLWNRVFPFRANGPVDMALGPGGDVYLFGSMVTQGPPTNVSGNGTIVSSFYARVSATGSLLYAYNLSEIPFPGRIATDPSTGGFAFVGQGTSYGTTYIASVAPDGTLRWIRASPGGTATPSGIGVDASGNVYVLVYRFNANAGVVRLDSSGNLVAQRAIGNPYSFALYPTDVAVTPSGAVYVLGSICCGALFVSGLNSNLTPLWTEGSQGSGFNDNGGRLVALSDGSLAAIVSSYSFNGTPAMNLYRFAASGAFLAGSSYVSPNANQGLGPMFAVTSGASLSDGGIVLGGMTFGVSPTSWSSVAATVSTPGVVWASDSLVWNSAGLTRSNVTGPLENPSVPVDNFNELAQRQAWYGVTDVPASKVSVSVSAKQTTSSSATVSFTATASGGRKPYSFAWSFGDGTFGTGATPTHTYPGVGQYLAQVTATDTTGVAGYGSAVVTVTGAPSILSILQNPTTNAYAGNWIAFYANAIDPDGGVINQYGWSFGDGSSDFTSYGGDSHIYGSPGNYTLTLTVTDRDQGLSASASLYVTILPRPDQPPFAYFYPSTYRPTVNTTVAFFAYYSYDPDGFLTQFRWDFGDGSTLNTTDSVAFHTYLQPGNFTVRLIVVDDANLTGTYNLSLSVVADLPPVANFTYYPAVPFANQTVFFEAAAYSYDPDGYIVSWLWNFGDGNNTGNGTNLGPYAYHAYARFGSYVVALTVVDNAGLRNSTSKTLYVNAPPVAVITASRAVGKVGSLMVFSGNASHDPDDRIVNYSWQFSDGSSASGAWVSHVFAISGQYTVTLSVVDVYGAFGYAAISYPVTVPKSPVAVIAWTPTRPIAGQTTVTFNGSNSLDPDGAITLYIWEFGDGIVGRGLTATHQYANAGTYTIELVVLDEDGLSNRDVLTITVVAPSKGMVAATSLAMPVALAGVTLSQGGAVVLELVTGADGSFSVGDLAPGTYAITISKDGYRAYHGTLVWDGINGDLGTFWLEPVQIQIAGMSPVQFGMVGILAAGMVIGGLVLVRTRRKRRRASSLGRHPAPGTDLKTDEAAGRRIKL